MAHEDIRCTDRRTINPRCPCACHLGYHAGESFRRFAGHEGVSCVAHFAATLVDDLRRTDSYRRCGPRQPA